MYSLNHNIFAHKVDDIKIIANIDSQIRKICIKHSINQNLIVKTTGGSQLKNL